MPSEDSRLGRRLGLPGALAIGLGAMVGTGLFAVWTPAAKAAGDLLVLALIVAAVIAALNATSTARLARVLPRAGGVYAYGSHFLSRPWGVTAGVVFILGKAASASAAALTIGTYVFPTEPRIVAGVALVLVLLLDLRGIVRSARVTAVMVSVVLVVIVAVLVVWWNADSGAIAVENVPVPTTEAFLGAVGLLFVAFAGYARITVLGEEVKTPQQTIPRAMAITFIVVLALYLAVAVTIDAYTRDGGTLTAAPLHDLARAGGIPEWVVSGAAVLAAGGVLLALIAGMGRTLFAMADARDAPVFFNRVRGGVPWRAEIAAAVLAGLGIAVGGIGISLALSATFILIYYAIAHLASWRVPGSWALQRLIPVLGGLGALVIAAASAVLAFASTS